MHVLDQFFLVFIIEVPQTLTAAVLTRDGDPLEIISGIKPPPLHRGQVLVTVAYSGVCHSQLMEIRGHRSDDHWVPHLLGHESTGAAVAVGDSVTKVTPGDWVVLRWIKGEGIEASGCRYEEPDSQIINSGSMTTFSDYTVVSENRAVPMPEGPPSNLVCSTDVAPAGFRSYT